MNGFVLTMKYSIVKGLKISRIRKLYRLFTLLGQVPNTSLQWRIRIIFIRIQDLKNSLRIRIQTEIDTDPDPGKNHTDPVPGQKVFSTVPENLQKLSIDKKKRSYRMFCVLILLNYRYRYHFSIITGTGTGYHLNQVLNKTFIIFSMVFVEE